MNRKQERRLQRHLRNKAKDETYKKEAWEAGKLIKPNHNGNSYDVGYSEELGKRLISRLCSCKELAAGDNEMFIRKFRLYKKKCIEYILHFDISQPKTIEYQKIKTLLEVYWDSPEHLIEVEI